VAIEIVMSPLKEELLRLARLDRNWVEWKDLGEGRYCCEAKYPTWIKHLWTHGADGFSMWALSACLVDGPKVFRPTREQVAALEQIEVRISLEDYAQPYPAVAVLLPERIGPFHTVVCHQTDASAGKMLTCVSLSEGHLDDITTTVAAGDSPIEESLQRYDHECAAVAKECGLALRVAVNSCLALANFGCQAAALFPREVESDQRITRKKAGTDADRRARERLAVAPQLLTFAQEVSLRGPTEGKRERGEPTGREVGCHWRRGHWRRQHYGAGNAEVKVVLIKPVLVRADRFLGDRADTEVTYK
jgi:hypothetical protein